VPSGAELPVGMFEPLRKPTSEFGPVVRETAFARDAVRMLRRHKLLFAVVFMLPTLLGLVLALALPPVYRASSTVMIETRGKDVVTLKEVLADVPADAEAISSEIEVLSSRELLELTATKLSLLDDSEFNVGLHPSPLRTLLATVKGQIYPWLKGLVGAPSVLQAQPMNQVVDSLRRHLVIVPIGQSRVIQIAATSHDPRTAAAIVNTLALVYTEEHLRLRDEANRQANDWIDGRIAELRSRADQSTAALEEYRIQHGLVRGRDSLLVQQQISDASTQLTAAQARRSQSEATLADAERALATGHPEHIAASVNSPAIQQLRQQEAQITARRSDLMARFGDAYPAAIAAAAQLRGVQTQIAAEANRIVQSLRDAASVARSDEVALTAHLNDARQQVDKANTLDVGLQQLQREANVDNALYQTFLTRSKETDPQYNFPTVNVRVLSRAVPSDWPISPSRWLIAIAGVVIGIGAGVVITLARDLLGRGLRTRADVERLIGLAPIGVIPFCHRHARPSKQVRVQEAVASLWARIVASAGGVPPKSIVITSAVMREGKTTLTRLLGAVAAEHGQRVLVVDADLRCSSLTARMHRRSFAVGLADLIRGETDLESVIVAMEQNVHILPAGHCKGSPIRLLASPGFAKVLREAERAYDVVIIDAPPVLIGADAWLLGCSAEATILVARWERTSRAVVELALRQLMEVGVRCIGLVLSIVDVNKFALYDDAASVTTSRRAQRYYSNLNLRK
jgi:polysaccharide biosynthesis transport protein